MIFPNLKQSVYLLIFFLLIQVGAGVLIAIVRLNYGERLHEENLLVGMLQLVGFLLLLMWIFRRTDRSWDDISQLMNIHFDWRVWPCVAISVAGMGVVLDELDKAVISIIPMSDFFQNAFQSTAGQKTTYSSALFVVVFVAPLIEELLYRGVILRGLLDNYTPTRAVVFSAILFGVGHLNPWQLPPAVIWGFILAWWVIRTGSLCPALLAHTLHNLIAVTIQHFDVPFFPVSEDMNVVVFNPWWWIVSGALVSASGLWWFNQVSRSGHANTMDGTVTTDAARDDR